MLVDEADVFFGETGLRHGGPIVGMSNGIGTLRVKQPIDPCDAPVHERGFAGVEERRRLSGSGDAIKLGKVFLDDK